MVHDDAELLPRARDTRPPCEAQCLFWRSQSV